MHLLTRLLHALRLAARALLDLALPEHCAGCDRPGTTVCERCAAPLTARPREAWPDPPPQALPRPWAVARYDDPVRALVVAHKEHGARGTLRPLGAALAESVSAAVLDAAAGWRESPHRRRAPPEIVLVPMPSRREATRSRGRDPTCDLAREAARQLRRAGVAASVLPALRLRRGVRDQAGLGSAARAANLAGAVQVRRRSLRLLADGPRRAGERRPPTVLLVDDVITTGASLSAAAEALRAHGVDVPAVAVVAATPRRPTVDAGRGAAGPGPARARPGG